MEIKERYVSYETAKLLKKEGFKEKCRTYYFIKKDNLIKKINLCHGEEDNYNEHEDSLSAPTQAMVSDWLRESQCITLNVIGIGLENGHERSDTFAYYHNILNMRTSTGVGSSSYFSDYMACVEDAIKYVLKYRV